MTKAQALDPAVSEAIENLKTQAPHLQQELRRLLSEQIGQTQRGYTLNGQELLRRGVSFAVPQPDVLGAWIERNWATFEADGIALAMPGNTWAEVMNLVSHVTAALQQFKGAGLPGLAREDVAGQVVAWLADKFGKQVAERTGRPLPWYWPMLANTVLPALVKAAWRRQFGK